MWTSAVLRCGLCALAADKEGQSTPSFLKSLTIDFSWAPGGKKTLNCSVLVFLNKAKA